LFWEPDPTNQVVYNIIDDGHPLYQQFLQRVIAEFQLLLGRCMAQIVKRSWLELANRETKQVFNFIFNDVQTCILLRARIQNFLILALIMSSSPL